MTDQHAADPFDLTGRVAVITGGSRGIGLAIAKGFAARGAKVVVASRKAESCEAAVKDIEAAGGTALAVAAHMGELDDLQKLVDRTVEHFGGIDIVVNNAANPLTLPIGHYTPEAWDKSMQVNLRGPIFLVQYALPYLRQSRGASVINVISAGVFLRSEPTSMYAQAKSGLLAYTRSAAGALAAEGIRVNALAPGTVDTDMVRNNTPDRVESMKKSSPLGRMADPDEMVGPALLLASDAGSYITGAVISADGGLTVH
ncbi:MAG: SDR family oxidoreductase [Streptomycetaceae bacterium]|jgi:NAD(P)-dependent dehydrogenase (short-subunit alcohol dehydrogenase family)|nr:SDR family oxidoreductase [Streptomycetaceae bacterium]